MSLYVATSLDYLIDDLRVHLGDVVEPYTYTMEYLRHVLVIACKTLMKKWRNRYTIDASYVVHRNPDAYFPETSPPVIERADERAFILQASIIVKGATLADSAWDVASWKDDEISYSNISGAKMAEGSLDRDREELEALLRRRLFSVDKQSMEGFRLPRNIAEGYH